MSIVWKDTNFFSKYSLNFSGELVEISRPKVMGILNLTPDSFFDGGKYKNQNEILQRVGKMVDDGADIIDIGAYSSRPGADNISEEEELSRLIPNIQKIVKSFPEIKISADTFRSNVARKAVESGASLVNDISAGNLDDNMFGEIAKLGVPYIMMHMRGNPKNMQELTDYENASVEIFKYFSERIALARSFGINDIIIDPGFGFAKNLESNYQLLKNLSLFQAFKLPILAGVSRKSMINKVANVTPDEALPGTITLNTIALLNGAAIIRVHDVKEAVDTVKIVSYYQNN